MFNIYVQYSSYVIIWYFIYAVYIYMESRVKKNPKMRAPKSKNTRAMFRELFPASQLPCLQLKGSSSGGFKA